MASSSNLPAFFILLPSPISCILPDWSKTFQKVTRILLVDVTLSCCHRNVKEMSLSLWQNSLRTKPTRSAPSSRENILTVVSRCLGTPAKPWMPHRETGQPKRVTFSHNSHRFAADILLQT